MAIENTRMNEIVVQTKFNKLKNGFNLTKKLWSNFKTYSSLEIDLK